MYIYFASPLPLPTILLVVPQIDRRNAEEDLTSKLTEHLEKIESLTQEVGLLQGKLTRCEDEKATTMLDTKKIKQRADDCETEKQQVEKEKVCVQLACMGSLVHVRV